VSVSQRATESIDVTAPPATLYAVAIDFADYPKWVNDLKQVTIKATDEMGRGTEVEFRAAAFGRSSTYALRYDYSQAPESLSWTQVRGDLTTRLDGSYRFESHGVGTRVHYQLEVDLLVPIPGFIKARAAQRIMSQALRELKARAEQLS
jgi:ribosome-associated toxin RatA of RatAB toxin-antitoxin module